MWEKNILAKGLFGNNTGRGRCQRRNAKREMKAILLLQQFFLQVTEESKKMLINKVALFQKAKIFTMFAN